MRMTAKRPHSVIVPILNEMQNAFFARIVDALSASRLDVVYVDGGSTDGTISYLEDIGCRIILAPQSNRAQRLNLGLTATSGAQVLLHHPRSLISTAGLEAFAALTPDHWGGFRHSFDADHPVLSFTSFYSNHIRFRRGIVYLDHCIFAPREWLVNVGGVPDLDIFEDTALSARLRANAFPTLLPFTLKTSAVRFTKNGIYTQSIMNQVLKLGYYTRWSRSSMNKRYEKDLELNQKVGKG